MSNKEFTIAPALRSGLLLTLAGAAASGAFTLAAAAPANAQSAAATISQLEATGFDVRVSRVGSAPLSECIVTNIGQPLEQRRLTLVQGRDDDDSRLVPVVFRRTISVSLNCSS
ncbi:hypothetical protein JRC04_18350 [Mycolicibacterium sp. S2-37]|uniref:hypothetical protein n=1 Tax=Mycolicibacterium sp. S2-37 TaxID=2810297 RepID=UPI001A947748|nr:hypothetical protein [Mycolicibacterium sp. S2-37]MBO0679427.1 hypothetical protein [Mycolicibacterium sp. S2-37]